MNGYVKIFTYGCQMNDLDTLKTYSTLKNYGWEPTGDTARADLIILNTCTVREKAYHKAVSNLGRLRKNKAAKPELILVVAGCIAQQEGDNLKKIMPHVDIILGTHQLHRLPELVQQHLDGKTVSARTDYAECIPSMDIIPDQSLADEPHRAYINIMQGCNNFCTYCIVPYVRGREISRAHTNILDEIRTHAAQGVSEVFLLGQNVNSYCGGISFADLLRDIAEIAGINRIRFTTSHPKDMSDDLIRCYAELPQLCNYIHLPFQSGSDKILKSMNRSYTADHYLSLIDKFRRAAPDMAFSSDVIVGFPGEDDRDFAATMELVHTVGFDNLFSFKYSPRPGTKAADYVDDVAMEAKVERLAILQSEQKKITFRNNRRRVGQTYEVLIDATSRHNPEQIHGRTQHFAIVNFKGSADMIGSSVPVRITRANQNSLTGEIPD